MNDVVNSALDYLITQGMIEETKERVELERHLLNGILKKGKKGKKEILAVLRTLFRVQVQPILDSYTYDRVYKVDTGYRKINCFSDSFSQDLGEIESDFAVATLNVRSSCQWLCEDTDKIKFMKVYIRDQISRAMIKDYFK